VVTTEGIFFRPDRITKEDLWWWRWRCDIPGTSSAASGWSSPANVHVVGCMSAYLPRRSDLLLLYYFLYSPSISRAWGRAPEAPTFTRCVPQAPHTYRRMLLYSLGYALFVQWRSLIPIIENKLFQTRENEGCKRWASKGQKSGIWSLSTRKVSSKRARSSMVSSEVWRFEMILSTIR